MAIHRVSDVRPRNRIGLVGEDPTDEVVVALAGYEVYRCDAASMADRGILTTTAGTIFVQSQSRPRRIAEQLREHAPALLNHGCHVFVQCLPGKEGLRFRKLIVDAINAAELPPSGLTQQEFGSLGAWFKPTIDPLTPLVHVLRDPDVWQELLRYLQLHPAGNGPTPGPDVVRTNADGIPVSLDLERTLLVQRAFWDSAEVRLEQLRNGLSGVDAYRAYVRQNSVIGKAWPYRYFVKIGARSKVAAEHLAYRDIALEHLPYHLGPRLRLERCELGHRCGILVSDYVNGAEPLRDCARDGRAAGVIANLFNLTYRAWHNGSRPEDISLQDHLRSRIPSGVPSFRQSLIDECGATKPLSELGELLVAGDSRPVSIGVIHGDLHATNVLVRGGDAILIDFEKVQSQGLVLRDLACLEAGLLIDGFVGDRRGTKEIVESLRSLYEVHVLLCKYAINPCHPADGSSWYSDCVVQIRMHARQFEHQPGQYALVLASELLRKACNEVNFDALFGPAAGAVQSRPQSDRIRMEQTRAMAYVLAERILVALTAGSATEAQT